MSTQVRNGICLNEFSPIPDLRPKWQGMVGRDPSAWAMGKVSRCDEPARRHDTPRRGGAEGYGGLTKSTPYMNSAKVDHAGVAIGKGKVAYDTVDTLHGSLKLPSERDEINYIPSVDALHFLSHSQGTRLLPHPPRYFP